MRLTFQLKVEPMGIEVNCDEEDTLLEVLLAEGVKVKNLCRAGRCGMCKSRVISGEVDHGNAGSDALMDVEREEYTLLCTATPLSDIEIEVEESIF
jgi:ferredoxin